LMALFPERLRGMHEAIYLRQFSKAHEEEMDSLVARHAHIDQLGAWIE
jgi:hypothetical protein